MRWEVRLLCKTERWVDVDSVWQCGTHFGRQAQLLELVTREAVDCCHARLSPNLGPKSTTRLPFAVDLSRDKVRS